MKLLLVSSLTLAVIAVSGGPLAAQKTTVLQKIIVKVNGQVFTQTELEFRQILALRDQEKAVRRAEDLTDAGLRAALAEVTPTLLLDAVDELMMVQHGQEIGVKFTEAHFTRALEDLKNAQTPPIKDDAALQVALKQEGITMADLRVNIERASIIQSVQQHELMRNMTLTDEEIRQYYNANQDQFRKPVTVTLREIFVAVPTQMVGNQTTINVGADEDAKAKITAARDRAMKGEDFAALVAAVSESGTKANGGVIGPIAAADLLPAVSQLLEKMKPGEISEPVRLRTGYQILKLEARGSNDVEPFDKAKEQITQRILENRMVVERAKFLDKLRLQAVIEWKDESYKKLYETARAARAKK